ncbi:hypothetical protein JY96_06350 [Aquabacterium sp. NJ1]|nr:hypothetical protein JY96_06350 [Aquabacterium sp. NJ1]
MLLDQLSTLQLFSKDSELEDVLPVVLEVGKLAAAARQPHIMEEMLELAQKIAPSDIVVAAKSFLIRADASSSRWSRLSLWNLLLRTSERESNELAPTLEAQEFGLPSGTCIDEVTAAITKVGELAGEWHGEILVELLLRSSYVFMLTGAADEAFGACDSAVAVCRRDGMLHLLPQALTMSALAKVSTLDLVTAEAYVSQVVTSIHRIGSHSVALACCLILVRWGRYSLIRRSSYPEASASFALAHKVATQFGLKILAAQALMDMASVDDSIGYRHLSASRVRLATSTFLRAHWQSEQPDDAVFNRVTFALNESALAYTLELNPDGVDLVCADMRRLLKRPAPKLPRSSEHAEARRARAAWLRHARYRLQIFGMMGLLAKALLKAREGDRNGVHAIYKLAAPRVARLPEDDRHFFMAQFARERNDIDTAFEATQAWAKLNLSRGILAEIRSFLESSGGELPQAELRVQAAQVLFQNMQGLNTVRKFQAAEDVLKKIEGLMGKEWFDTLPKLRLQGRLETAKLKLGLRRPKEALEVAQAFIQLYEEIEAQVSDDARMLAVTGEHGLSDAYVIAAAAFIELGRVNEAWQVGECGRGRALKHLLAQSERPEASETASKEGRHVPDVQAAIDASRTYRLSQEPARHSDNADGIFSGSHVNVGTSWAAQSGLREAAVARQQRFLEEAEIASTARRCPHNTTILAFSLVEDIFLSWSVDSTGLRSSHRMSLESREVAQLVAGYLRACTELRGTESFGTRLSKLLLEPHAASLPVGRDVVIAPYGDLFRLPIHALPFDDGKPFGMSRAVSYVPAASIVGRPYRQSRKHSAPVVVGRPDSPGDAIHRELVEVGSTLGCEPVISSGLQKAELLELVSLGSPIHIAAHGHFDPEQPWLSTLNLVGADDLVSAGELAQLKLHAELVTLGACSTGAADRMRNDVTGFARAFLAAGVGTCVLSLWEVDSSATHMLMATFYQGIAQGKSPALALQTAQAALVDMGDAGGIRGRVRALTDGTHDDVNPSLDWSHPYFWAGFVAIGPRASS